MIREKQRHLYTQPWVIDLTGPEGNAYCLLGYAANLAEQLGFDETAILADMKSGDYEHLIEVFDNNFGHLVILER